MKKSSETVTIKTQVTIRRDMWEKLSHYMDNPTQARKVVYEALRRFWEGLGRAPQPAPLMKAAEPEQTLSERIVNQWLQTSKEGQAMILGELILAVAKIMLWKKWNVPPPDAQVFNRWN